MSDRDPESGLSDGHRRSSLHKSLDDSVLPGVYYIDDSTENVSQNPASAVDHENQQKYAGNQPEGEQSMEAQRRTEGRLRSNLEDESEQSDDDSQSSSVANIELLLSILQEQRKKLEESNETSDRQSKDNLDNMINLIQSRQAADSDEEDDKSFESPFDPDSKYFTVGSRIGQVVGVVISIMMLSIGSCYLHDCNIQKYIPIYLIVSGVFGILNAMVTFMRSRETFKDSSCFMVVFCLLNIFISAWFIAGCVWVYKAYEPNYDNKTSKDYCHKTLYLFSFWLLNSIFILCGVLILVGICAICVLLAKLC